MIDAGYNETPQRCDPCTLPLQGLQIVQASAGNGKTYLLGSLVLRALIEPVAELRDIVLVTYTNKGALDLQRRTVERVINAYQNLETYGLANTEGAVPFSSDDAVLSYLVDRHGLDHCYQMLRIAMAQIDQMQCSTIHACCRSWLQQLPELPSSYIENEVRGSEPLKEAAARVLAEINDTVTDSFIAELLRQTTTMTTDAYFELGMDHFNSDTRETNTPPCSNLQDALLQDPQVLELQNLLQELVDAWEPSKTIALHDVLADAPDNVRIGLLLKDLNAVQTGDCTLPLRINRYLALLKSIDKLILKNFAQVPKLESWHSRVQPCLKSVQALCVRPLIAQLVADSITAMRQQMAQESGVYDFNGLILSLAQAIEQGGDAERSVLESHCKLLLVDEFQDMSDPMQRVMTGLDCPTVIVGDSKQLIYSNLGANVESYNRLLATIPTESLWFLQDNQRFSESMLADTNRLFSVLDPTHDVGGDDTEYFLGVPFHESTLPTTGTRAGVLQCTAGTADSQYNQAKYGLILQEYDLADEDEKLPQSVALADALVDFWKKVEAENWKIDDRDIQLEDCAILVNTNREVERVCQVLQQYGISCSRRMKGSIFETAEAQILALVIEWLLHQQSATVKMLHYLIEKRYRDLNFDRAAPTLQQVEQQLMAMDADSLLYSWLDMAYAVYNYWFTFGDTAPTQDSQLQVFADLVVLGEVLSSWTSVSAEDCWQRLVLQIEKQASKVPASASQDSDEEQRKTAMNVGVQVMTIHLSKGLQFPFVWVWQDSAPIRKRGAQDAAEVRRISYVSLTRAVYQTRVITDTSKKEPALVAAMRDCDFHTQALQPIGEDLPSLNVRQSQSTATSSAWLEPVELQLSWRASSYSSIMRSLHTEHDDWLPPDADDSHIVGVNDEQDISLSPDYHSIGKEVSIHNFPIGARAGSALHYLLEKAVALGWELPESDKIFADLCWQMKLDLSWVEPLRALVGNIANIKVLDTGQTIATAGSRSYSEVDFEAHFARSFDSLLLALIDELGYDASMPLEHFKQQLYLRGSIDLVWTHKNHGIYIVDFKSNFLGPTDADYVHNNYVRAVRSHMYDLQLALYTCLLLRLRRTLQPQLPPIIGAGVLFLRGVAGENSGMHALHVGIETLQAIEESHA